MTDDIIVNTPMRAARVKPVGRGFKFLQGALFACLLILAGCAVKGQCLLGDCLNGEGELRYPNGQIYSGKFIDGRPDGTGVLIYPDGKKYRGEFDNHKPEGLGELTLRDGSKKVGIFADGQFTGKGKLVFADGQELPCIIVDGEYVVKVIKKVKAKPEKEEAVVELEVGGSGAGDEAEEVASIEDDSEAEDPEEDEAEELEVIAEPVDDENGPEAATGLPPLAGMCMAGDCDNGKGSFVYDDESFYSGSFLNGRPDGHGSLSKSDGEVYVGDFKNGRYDGRGILEYPDGRVYEGEFVDGVRADSLKKY